MRRHVMFDQIGIAVDPADQVCLVSAGIKITMADLAVIVSADRVISLANMDEDVHVIGQSLDRHVDDLHSGLDLLFTCSCKIRLVNLQMLASFLGELPKILMKQFSEIG